MTKLTKASNTVPVPSDAWAVIEDGQKKMAEINNQLNTYIAGLRHGLNVPEDWKIDPALKAFVPPEK